jgi:rubrerythrin
MSAKNDFDDQDIATIPDSEITSGRMMFLSLLLKVATADEEEAINFYETVFNAVGAGPN